MSDITVGLYNDEVEDFIEAIVDLKHLAEQTSIETINEKQRLHNIITRIEVVQGHILDEYV
jgi:hypothetical protein